MTLAASEKHLLGASLFSLRAGHQFMGKAQKGLEAQAAGGRAEAEITPASVAQAWWWPLPCRDL